MTPEEELGKLNRLIKQYETVYRTATDPEQKERVAKELKELLSYRKKLLAVHIIDKPAGETVVVEDELSDYPILRGLTAEQQTRDGEPTDTPAVGLYARFFGREYIPLLTEMHLKLDFKFSMERDSFYGRFQDLERKLVDLEEETARLSQGGFTKEIELEVRKRALKLKRILEVEASRFFASIERFAAELLEDAQSDGVKCLNADSSVSFDRIEGRRLLAGRTVREALEEVALFAGEVTAYVNIPDMEIQENDRADRY